MNTARNGDEEPSDQDWATSVARGKLDRRVLNQTQIWVDATGRMHPLAEMSPAYLFNVLSLLRDNALRLHFEAMTDSCLDLLEGAVTGTPPVGEGLAYELTGRSIAALKPSEWLESSAFVRALRRLIDQD